MQPDLFSPPLDYSIVDSIGRARQRAIEPKLSGQIFRASAFGPIVELLHLLTNNTLADLRALSWFEEASLTPILDAFASRKIQWLQGDGSRGLLIGNGLESEQNLTSFKVDAHKAALRAGFAKAAPMLVAALGELIGNIVDHSEATVTGVAAFAARPGMFEFVVADQGIGALRSLTKNPAYAALPDEGAALAAMIETGISRFDAESGHGNGFRPIFEKLAHMTGELRFRSGDHGLSLDGRFGDRILRQISQKPRLPGLLAAVSCQAPLARSR